MTAIGLYLPRTSPIHRMPPSSKLVALGVLELGILAGVQTVPVAAAAAVAVAALYRVGGVPARTALRHLRAIVLLALVIAAVQVVPLGLQRAVVLAAQLVLCVAAATLATLTTQVAELLDAIHKALAPLQWFGVDPARAALVMALAIRTVPLLTSLLGEIREARVARGARLSATRIAVLLIVRTLAHAERLGEAMVARGIDD